MHVRDVVTVAAAGLRTRRTRVLLSAGGVAVGIAAVVAVIGVSASSRADLLSQLDRLGTNLLTVQPGRDPGGGDAAIPATAPAMIARIAPVLHVTAVAQLDATVRRTDRIPAADTGGITVAAARTDLLTTLNVTVAHGRFLDPALEQYPTVVLGAEAADQLGIDQTDGRSQVFLADRWFTVVGILQPVPLVGDLDRAALIGYPAAHALLGHDPPPTTIYLRANPDDVLSVAAVLARTANPAHPNAVSVGRPSDVLTARAAAKTALTSLFVGLGAIALLVGGLGIANVMVVAVLERRHEIGVRRALGATRLAIATQFLTEALLLSALGGATGVVAGSAVTIAWTAQHGLVLALPAGALFVALFAAIIVGAIAGLLPAARAGRLAPTDALRA